MELGRLKIISLIIMKEMYNFKAELGIIVMLLTISVIICLQSPMSIISNTSTGTDSSVFRYIALEIKNGKIPYVDTFDHKGLLIYIINYIGILISYNHGIWFLEIVSMYIVLYFSYKTIKLFANRIAAILSISFVYSILSQLFEGGNLTEEWALPFICISLYIFSKYYMQKTTSSVDMIICGICCSAVIMLRINMIAVWIVFSINLFIYLCNKKDYKYLLKCISMFIIGIIIGIFPMLAYLFKNNAINDFINCYLTFNFTYQHVGLMKKANTLYFFLSKKEVLLIIAMYIYIYIYKVCYVKISKELLYTYIGSSIVSVLFMSMSGRNYAHYGMILLPTYMLPVGIIFNECIKYLNARQDYIKKFVSIILIYLIIIISGSYWIDMFGNLLSISNRNNKSDNKIISIIRENTNDTDKISVEGNNNKYYVLSGRLSASRYSYQKPISDINSKIMDEYIDDLEKNIPKIILKAKVRPDKKLECFIKENNYKLIYDDNEYYSIYKYEQ